MEAISCTKSVAVLTLILLCGVYFSSAQPGFLSIDCGGKGIRTDNETGITWIPDDNYAQGGRREDLNDSSLKFYQQSLRVFPKPLSKSCYHLPITPNVPFLLRLFFVGFNYSNQIPDFKYSIETKDMFNLRNVTSQTKPPQRSEKILVSGGEVLYICLIRTSGHVDPFISSIELRPLQQGMYNQVKPGLMLHFIMRYNLGALEPIRYPQDRFDRVWNILTVDGSEIVTSGEPISTNDTEDFPPAVVMQTAVATEKDRIDISMDQSPAEMLLLVYFAEIRNSSETTIFDILIDNVERCKNFQLVRNRSAIQIPFLTNYAAQSFTLFKNSTSTSGPIINGFELYERVATSNRTSLQDDERKGKTVGVIVGAIAMVGLLLLLGIIIYRKKFRRKEIVNSGTKGSTSANRESVSVRGQDYSFISVPSTPKSRSFSLDEMLTATKNFSNKIGQGGFGSVFLGEFEEGKQIAVKVLSFFSKQGVAQFLNEIELLSRAHHRNLVCLLGYCNASRDLMLVYEYMSGSSLNDHLYGRNASNSPKLDWKTRLKIALDAAQGLEYLHTKCTPKIIHRDIKTANILLDANLTGKLADFGLSRVATDDVSHVTTAVRGTAGYVDPKYFTTHMLTEKSDVYSFGVVLLEIICGRRPIDITLSEPQVDLVKWVTPYMVVDEDAVNIIEIVDKSLGNSYDKESITRVAKLAMRCIESEPSHRPSVSDVVTGIKDAMKYEI